MESGETIINGKCCLNVTAPGGLPVTQISGWRKLPQIAQIIIPAIEIASQKWRFPYLNARIAQITTCYQGLICAIRASNRSLIDSKVLFINSKDKICAICGSLRHPEIWVTSCLVAEISPCSLPERSKARAISGRFQKITSLRYLLINRTAANSIAPIIPHTVAGCQNYKSVARILNV